MENRISGNYLIVDVEATCWEREDIRQQESEIIEIGAVLFDAEKRKSVREFQSFIRPVRNPVLSDFCKQLTSIKQGDVDSAPVFQDVINTLKEQILYQYDYFFASWGEYDRKQFIRDCEYHHIEYPFGEDHLNLKKLFAKKYSRKPCGMTIALDMLNISMEGIHHRGIDDARNITKIFDNIIVSGNNKP